MGFDLLLYNATFYTLDPRFPVVEAVGIRGERIAAIGSADELRDGLDDGERAIDLGGQTVIPGLTDAHVHFVQFSLRLMQPDIYELPSLEETLGRIADHVATLEPGQWLYGGGWNCNLWGDGTFPHRHDLDRVAPNNPVALASKDGHSLWVNSRALTLAGITAQTPDPPGGCIRRDPAGEPTGILHENAMAPVYKIIPRPTLEEQIAACRRGLQAAHRVGLTGIHDCEGSEALAVFQELHRRGELSMRVLMHIPAEELDAAIALGIRDGLGDDWLRLGGVKAFADGSLGSRSAWMLEPYEGERSNRGIPTMTATELRDLAGKANRAGLSVAIHAIGDAANRAVIDAIAAARQGAPPWLRNRIEHVQLLHPDDLPRLGELGIVASMQPIHATADIDIAERHWGARSATAYAWRSLLDTGATLAFGSDAPVENISPLLGIHAAATRRRADGSPGPDGWHPEQRISVVEAIRAYTLGAAYAAGMESSLGSLSPGKLADLVVLDRDILKVAPMEIADIQVINTMVGGQFIKSE